MACFLVPVAEAAVVKILEKSQERKEIKVVETEQAPISDRAEDKRIPLSRKLRWLSWMLIGGAVLLAFEHVWHGELVPWFPFLTSMSDPAAAADMFTEMATVGVAMSAAVTAVWAGVCAAADRIVRRADRQGTLGRSE